jgi:hypothetical protein
MRRPAVILLSRSTHTVPTLAGRPAESHPIMLNDNGTFIDSAPARCRARAAWGAYELSLRRGSRRTRPSPDFQNAVDEAKRGFEAFVLRGARAWKPRLKTRDAARLRLAAARYHFARYPIAEHLEKIWIDCRGLGAGEISCASAGTSWLLVADRSTGRVQARGCLARRSMRSSIRRGASVSRKRSGRRSRVPMRKIPASRSGSRAQGSHRRRAPSLASGITLRTATGAIRRSASRDARLPRSAGRRMSGIATSMLLSASRPYAVTLGWRKRADKMIY